MSDLFWIILISLPLGALAGFAAGLFGIGGGAIIVPVLFYLFTALGYDLSVNMHMAVGTSLLTIIPTAIVSSYTHYKHHAIEFSWFRSLVFGVAAGAVLGGFVAIALPEQILRRIFAILLFVMAFLMLRKRVRNGEEHTEIKYIINTVYGVFSGLVSALIGIGGATLNVPFMVKSGLKINRAIATASLLGLSIALPGSMVFLFSDAGQNTDIPHSWGYIHYGAAIAIVSMSMITAKYGACLTHRMNLDRLKYAFAALMVLVAIKMVL